MNLIQTAKNILGIGRSAPSVTNIAAETPLSRAIGTRGRIRLPVGGGRRKDDAPLTDEEKKELGFEDPKLERIRWSEMTSGEQLAYNDSKRKRQREAAAKRAADKKQKRLDELQHGLHRKFENEYMRFPLQGNLAQICALAIEAERLNVSPLIAACEKPQSTYDRLSDLMREKFTHSAIIKREKNRFLEFRKAYAEGREQEENIQPIDYDRAAEVGQLHRSAIKKALGRQLASVIGPFERFVMGELIPAIERIGDRTERAELEQHAAAGGKLGLKFQPSAFLIALKQAPVRLAEIVKTSPSWHCSPRRYAAEFGIILPEKK